MLCLKPHVLRRDRRAATLPDIPVTEPAGAADRWARLFGSYPYRSHGLKTPATKLSKRLRDRLYWFRLSVLWGSRNDFLSRISDPVPELRNRWIAGRTAGELRVDLTDRTEFSFLLMGDTGEGDYSQYVLVPPLCKVADRSNAAFVFICSDVMYPVGNINEYGDKFYDPIEPCNDRSMHYLGTMTGTTICRHTCTISARPSFCRSLQPMARTLMTSVFRLGHGACGMTSGANFVRYFGGNQDT